MVTGLVTAAASVAWFVPSWLSVGRTSVFLVNEFETTGFVAMVGRWGVKNIAFFGVPGLLVLVVLVPVLLPAVRLARTSVLARFSVVAAVVERVALPALPVEAGPPAARARLPRRPAGGQSPDPHLHVAALVSAQVLLAFVSVTVAEPDITNAATTGRLHLGVEWGVVVNDLDCRIDPPYGEGGWPDLDTPAADYAAIDVFTCQARSWRPGGIPDDYGQGASSGRAPPRTSRPSPDRPPAQVASRRSPSRRTTSARRSTVGWPGSRSTRVAARDS